MALSRAFRSPIALLSPFVSLKPHKSLSNSLLISASPTKVEKKLENGYIFSNKLVLFTKANKVKNLSVPLSHEQIQIQ